MGLRYVPSPLSATQAGAAVAPPVRANNALPIRQASAKRNSVCIHIQLHQPLLTQILAPSVLGLNASYPPEAKLAGAVFCEDYAPLNSIGTALCRELAG